MDETLAKIYAEMLTAIATIMTIHAATLRQAIEEQNLPIVAGALGCDPALLEAVMAASS